MSYLEIGHPGVDASIGLVAFVHKAKPTKQPSTTEMEEE